MAEKILKTSGKEREEEPAVNKEGKKVGKSKREKRRREDAVDEELNEESTEPQKKKHKKNKTGFPDPNEDSSLSEQASKALSYAFTQFRKQPSKWKFSKARQNWIIRNIWSDTIPDTYVELTIQYLSNVKGGVREKLIKDCQSVLSTSADKNGNLSAKEIAEAKPVTADAATETNEPKHKRARTLLDALETSENGSK